ncbi:MAG TPA: hypothetical protein VD767_06005 [Thermomicrobiales bacterium]|nr:hypothetical protein [Thermomicrobiales bacterium]
MARNPVVFIHGYSDTAESFQTWATLLEARGYDVTHIHSCNYRTLTNEVSLRDIAEAFDRALRLRAGLDQGEEFDAIVHSTGMLVIRAWLATYAERRSRLKHLVGLAPATFGSPLAHKGRSWLGAIFKGEKDIASPDFLEAGDRVLDGLELGSRFTWDLAHLDLLSDKPVYGTDDGTPYVFVFCGTEGYRGIRQLVNEPGTDGTVRWAGCALDTRKIIVNLSRQDQAQRRFEVKPWHNVDAPFYPVAGKNHGSLLRDPGEELVNLVVQGLEVSSVDDLAAWQQEAEQITGTERQRLRDDGQEWQQFVVRATDERGDPITDYNLQLLHGTAKDDDLAAFDTDVHVYSSDRSLRSFHVKLGDIAPERLQSLWARIMVSSGTRLVGYAGEVDRVVIGDAGEPDPTGWWEGWLDLTRFLEVHDQPRPGDRFTFFYPFTTTLIDLRLNREPLPLEGPNEVAVFT